MAEIQLVGTYVDSFNRDTNYQNSDVLSIGYRSTNDWSRGLFTFLYIDKNILSGKTLTDIGKLTLFKKVSRTEFSDGSHDTDWSIFTNVSVYSIDSNCIGVITYSNHELYVNSSNLIGTIDRLVLVGTSTKAELVNATNAELNGYISQCLNSGKNVLLRFDLADGIIHEYSQIYNNSNSIVINSTIAVPIVSTIYPNGINIEASKNNIFTWEYYCVGTLGAISQKSYEIQYSLDQINWSSVTNNSSNQYHQFDANTFSAGDTVYWKVRCTGTNNATSSWSKTVSCKVIGATGAPEITSATMEAMPTITWTVASQSAYEMKIISNTTGKTVYQSGLVTSSNTTVTLNHMFTEDNYTISMRALNEYGYYTDWNSYNWVLTYSSVATTPETPVVNVINGYLIDILTFNSLTAGKDKYWIVRTDEDGNEEVVSVHYENETIDNKCALNKTYYYTVRHFNDDAAGFADSEAIISYVEAKGAVISTLDGESFHLWMNEDNEMFTISKADSTEKTFQWVIGRNYPVMEKTDWLTVRRSVKAHITEEEFNKLLEISHSHNGLYYRSDGEAFLCDMEMSFGKKYIGGGVIVQFTFTRINEDEVTY